MYSIYKLYCCVKFKIIYLIKCTFCMDTKSYMHWSYSIPRDVLIYMHEAQDRWQPISYITKQGCCDQFVC